MSSSIGIDARKLNDFGIGTYIHNLIRSLAEIDQENDYVLFVGPPGRDILSDLPENFRLVFEKSPAYSVRELVALSWQLFRLRSNRFRTPRPKSQATRLAIQTVKMPGTEISRASPHHHFSPRLQ